MYWGFCESPCQFGGGALGAGEGETSSRVGAKRLVATLQGPSGIRERRRREAEQDFLMEKGR
jgi:hypothetical protein